MCCIESLYLVMVVFKMDNNIEKKVVELRRMSCMTNLYTMTRLRMRVIKTIVVDLRRGNILTKNTMTRVRMRVIKKK
jgi:hypothetical protein